MFSRMIKAVLDTNVFISALFWTGSPHNVLAKALESEFILITSREILKEIEERLLNKFKFPVEDILSFLEIIVLNSHIVEPNIKLEAVPQDPNDNKIIECAVSGNADYIVTGDKDILELKAFREIKILTPNQFLKILNNLK